LKILHNCKQRSNLTRIENSAKILNKRRKNQLTQLNVLQKIVNKNQLTQLSVLQKIVNKNQLTQLNESAQNQR